MELQSSKIVNEVFQRLYMHGYTMPEIVKDSFCCQMVEKMAEIKKINGFLFGMILDRLEQNRELEALN